MIADILVLLGLGLMVAGLVLISVPLAAIASGAVLVLMAFGLSRRREAS